MKTNFVKAKLEKLGFILEIHREQDWVKYIASKGAVTISWKDWYNGYAEFLCVGVKDNCFSYWYPKTLKEAIEMVEIRTKVLTTAK